MLFDRFDSYGFIHHRGLNKLEELAKSLDLVRRHPDRIQSFEGDICWFFSGNKTLHYFRNPSYVIDTLLAFEVEKGLADGSLVGLHSLAPLKPTNAYLTIELKVGRGNWKRALEYLVEYLQTNFPDRYWLDSFSPTLLAYVKEINPSTTVTLHTECIINGRIVIDAPEWPPLRIRRIKDLDFLDGISKRRRGTEAFMARACRDVHKAGKALIVARLWALRHFECSRIWGAKAGNMKWDFDELLAYSDRLDKTGIGFSHGKQTENGL